jgi:hypothetical protein
MNNEVILNAIKEMQNDYIAPYKNTAIVPANIGQRYYAIHYQYMINLLFQAGVDIHYYQPKGVESNILFEMTFNGKRCFVDYSDGGWYHEPLPSDTICFKFHFKKEDSERDRYFPFAPISFYDWDYKERNNELGNTVFYNQRAYGNAVERRNYVANMLQKNCKNLDMKIRSQKNYFNAVIDNAVVSIHVPGQNNNMLDRAQLQMMAIGIPTISPKLPEILPFNHSITPGWHYWKCEDDYSDLIEVIEKASRHQGGSSYGIPYYAKLLFYSSCIPKKIVEWMNECIMR